MVDKTESQYDKCMNEIRELINAWEIIRPEEELIVMVLPKYDQKGREERLKEICKMILEEKW